jgi:hypothetical protein
MHSGPAYRTLGSKNLSLVVKFGELEHMAPFPGSELLELTTLQKSFHDIEVELYDLGRSRRIPEPLLKYCNIQVHGSEIGHLLPQLGLGQAHIPQQQECMCSQKAHLEVMRERDSMESHVPQQQPCVNTRSCEPDAILCGLNATKSLLSELHVSGNSTLGPIPC